MIRKLIVAAVASASLAGCASWLAPDYQRPQAPIPTAWPQGEAYPAAVSRAEGQPEAADIGWRDFIRDDRLRELVALALANNRDLRLSALNIEKARAQYGVARADLFPSVNAVANGNHQQAAKDLTTDGSPRTTHVYGASLGFSAYELDFFGRIQNLKDAALHSYLRTVAARNTQQITLVAEVASRYLTLAADRARLQIAQATLSNQQENYDLTRKRFDLGVVGQLDLSSAETTVEAARADVAGYTAAVAQDLNALTLLVGTTVPEALMPPEGVLDGAPVLQEVPAGVSSEVLLRRPDLLADEESLRAMNANIGAARAAFFPSIVLTAAVGTGSNAVSRLFQGANDTWSFVPQVSLPIFRGGGLFAALGLAKADREIAVAQYEKDIQTAFREVADALAQRGTVAEQVRALQAYTDASEVAYRLNNTRYQVGVSSYLDLLVAQRALYSAQQNLVAAKLSQQTNLVTLYKTLGGGVRENTGQP